MKIVYLVGERNSHGYDSRIGVAFVAPDGSMSVKLEAIPLSGELQIREYSPRREVRLREALPREALPREALPREALPREVAAREAVPRQAVASDGVPPEPAPGKEVHVSHVGRALDGRSIGPSA